MEWAPQFPAEMLAQHHAYLQPMMWAFLIGSLLTVSLSVAARLWSDGRRSIS
ncbi:BQ5605_C024g09800 [Microbotryum silenes-dioicae]|uniref:BQ5605_C024g09800 protein n=1 Tax=Microbotryum silenes-dioicae TaxID=796604 RepID=A0A2X0PLY9_9BASI|nr:BQ5605_C024g09800 [Microbotryum silenes-dioicae]